MTPAPEAVNPSPCSPACAAAVRRLADETLPTALAEGLDRPPGVEAADSELNLTRFSARGRRWHVAGLVATLGGRTPHEMAARIEAGAGPDGDLDRAAAGCRSLAETLGGGGGASGLILKSANEPCCVFNFGPEAADYWRTVGSRLSFHAIQRILKAKAGRIPKL